MNNSATIAHRGRSRASALMVVVSVMGLIAASALAKDSNPSPGDAKAADLTGLSLQALYDLEVVQPNVLGGHTHPAGQIMFGFQYMHVNSGDIYDGSEKISAADVFAQGYGAAHIQMDMDMEMLDVMYAPSDRLTLMAMLPYKEMSMLHQRTNGTRFTQNASGIGDLEAMALYTLLGDIRKGGNRLVLNAGVSFPTGSINVQDHRGGDPALPLVQLEYPMQLGSGTYDLLPGLTYLGEAGRWCWGAQSIETIRLGENDAGYALGNQYRLSAWASYGITSWFAPSLRLDACWWNDIDGTDARLNPQATPEGDPDLQGGSRLDLLFGLNFYVPNGWLKGNRLIFEGGFPIYQDLNGPQLGVSWMFALSWSYAF